MTTKQWLEEIEMYPDACLCSECGKEETKKRQMVVIDVYVCGECGTSMGDGFRIQDGIGSGHLLLCSTCLATLRSKIDALTILISTGADTR
jgi:hypothetical protein